MPFQFYTDNEDRADETSIRNVMLSPSVPNDKSREKHCQAAVGGRTCEGYLIPQKWNIWYESDSLGATMIEDIWLCRQHADMFHNDITRELSGWRFTGRQSFYGDPNREAVS